MFVRLFRLLVPGVVFLFLGTVSVSACVCTNPGPVRAELKEAAAVFAGRYIRSEFRSGIRNENYEIHAEFLGKKGEEYEVRVDIFEVQTWWKGPGTREVILVTDNTRAKDGTESVSSCGVGFEKGREYLVYAYTHGDRFSTSPCSRTARLERAAKDIASLNKLIRPKQPV